MAHYFKYFPTVEYDIKKNGKPITVPNIFVGLKVRDLVQRKKAVFYEYNVQEDERADTIAFKYYGDATLDWVIFLTNQIIDPQFEWPLDRRSLDNYITKKYGSLQSATSTVHHYEQILHAQTTTYDGITVPERTVQVDEATYNSLGGNERKVIYNYDYELDLNDKKREIKLLDERYIINLINSIEEELA